MSLAAETRAAVRARPFLLAALRAGVVNYAAAARAIDVGADTEAVATALRRFAERLPAMETEQRRARVTMHGGIRVGSPDPMLAVGDVALGQSDGSTTKGEDDGPMTGTGPMTGVLATGDVDVRAMASVLGVLDAHGIEPAAAGVAGDAMVVVVERRNGPEAVQRVEEALSAVPAKATV